jgi:hypothetical protein
MARIGPTVLCHIAFLQAYLARSKIFANGWFRPIKSHPILADAPAVGNFLGSAVVPTAAVGVPPTASSFTN